jgi:hypothetical protein
MLISRGVLSVAAAACVVAATAAPSEAMSEDHRDAAKDVVSGSLFTDALPKHPEPARRLGDIVRNKVSYGTDLVVTTKLRSLTASGQQEFSWFLLPSGGEEPGSWNASLVVQPGKDKGTFTLLDPIANQPGCGKAVLDRPARTVTLTIPALCLHDPATVRVGNGVRIYVERGSDTVGYADDAHLDGVVKNGWKYGPRLTRDQ